MNNLLKKSYEKIRTLFLENLELGEDVLVLDVGCGLKGNFIETPGVNYVGIDLNERIAGKNGRKGGGLYLCMDARNMAFKDNSFDRVVSTSFFHHLDDENCLMVLREIKRILKKNGRLIIADGVFPLSPFNFLGWVIRFLDRGRYVRSMAGLLNILKEAFGIIKRYYFVDKIFAYGVFVMGKK